MTRLVITHAVKDVEHWLKFHEERVQQLSPFGTNVREHTAVDGSKNVALTMDVQNPSDFYKAMAAPPPDLLAAMDRHGVVPPLMTHEEA